MTGSHLTPFEHVLLGMICGTPSSSGYDLKRRFASSPLGVYEPSSGALYPALHRLVRKGLIQGQPAARPAAESGTAAAGQPEPPARNRQLYRPTPLGTEVHLGWIRIPVDPATIARELPVHLMRFAMMEHLVPREEVLTFLRSLRDALAAFVEGLEQFVAGTRFTDRHPPLAIGHGVASHRASLAWAEDTIAALSAAAPLTGPRPPGP
jgi:Transcriptional regulator PadR-like family